MFLYYLFQSFNRFILPEEVVNIMLLSTIIWFLLSIFLNMILTAMFIILGKEKVEEDNWLDR